MLDLIMTGQFKRDLKRIQKRGLELELLKNVLVSRYSGSLSCMSAAKESKSCEQIRKNE